MLYRCEELISKCTLADYEYNGTQCCQNIFDPEPIFIDQAVCYRANKIGAKRTFHAKNGFKVHVVTSQDNTFSEKIIHV